MPFIKKAQDGSLCNSDYDSLMDTHIGLANHVANRKSCLAFQLLWTETFDGPAFSLEGMALVAWNL